MVGLNGMSRRMDVTGLCRLWLIWVARLDSYFSPRLEYGYLVLYPYHFLHEDIYDPDVVA